MGKRVYQKLTVAEKKSKQGILLKYSASMLIDKNVRRSCNISCLFLQDIYYSLGMDKICDEISEKYRFEYNINEILSMLVYSRIIHPVPRKLLLPMRRIFWNSPDVIFTMFTERLK